MTFGYIRVSTDKQTLENQKEEILRFAESKELNIHRFIEETISGKKEYDKRQLGRLIRSLRKDDILIVSELSRLGRSFYMIMEILNVLHKKGVHVYSIKENFYLSDNLESKVIAFAFSLSAEIERQLISQRTREALIRIKAEGKKLGRPVGSKNKTNLYERNKEKIDKYLKKNKSLYYISKKLKINTNTLYKYKRMNIISYCK